ncbi:MAG: MoaD/ThiS family protein [Alphaproteobacteria bacterium]|nr:MoaD/ThiS family protein [Alphaproteobacteria bacterium]
MNIKLKLYASLMRYLPDDAADRHTAVLNVPEGMTPARLIEDRKLPKESCFLVLLNGVYLTPAERETRQIQEGDAVAIWPPIAGG